MHSFAKKDSVQQSSGGSQASLNSLELGAQNHFEK